MAVTLYSAVSKPPQSKPLPVAEPQVSIESLFVQLDKHLQAHESVQIVHAEIAEESLTFVDQKNVTLFNEYMRQLQRNLGVSPQLVSPIAVESMPVVTVNYDLALEGWLKTMWEKIKGFFSKIYESIKEFMKKHFTRLGRLKNKLKNIQTVAKETDKNIAQVRIEDIPSSLASKFKGVGQISEATVTKIIKTSSDAVTEIKSISSMTSNFASNGIVDADFVTNIRKLKEVALNATKQIGENDAKKKNLKFTDFKGKRAIKEDNKSLAEIAKNAKALGEDMEADVSEMGQGGDTSDESLQQKGQQAYKEYMKKLVGTLEKFKDVPMVGGKTIKKVSVTEDNELEVEFEEEGDAEDVKGATLTNKEGVQKLAAEALKMIELGEAQADAYAKTNDTIMDKLKAIDNLILDIDRNDPAKYGSYKKVLDQQIRTRLNMMKVLFRSYNQVSRNFYEVAVNTGDAVVDYCVICMKNFK